MKRLIISGFASIALLTAATTILRSHSASTDRTVAVAGTMSSRGAVSANKLPIEEFEDLSLVYSTAPKR